MTLPPNALGRYMASSNIGWIARGYAICGTVAAVVAAAAATAAEACAAAAATLTACADEGEVGDDDVALGDTGDRGDGGDGERLPSW